MKYNVKLVRIGLFAIVFLCGILLSYVLYNTYRNHLWQKYYSEIQLEKTDNDKYEYYAKKALKVAILYPIHKDQEAKTLVKIASFNRSKGKYAVAIKYYLDALKYFQNADSVDKRLCIDIQIAIGDLYMMNEDNDTAKKYYYLAIDEIKHFYGVPSIQLADATVKIAMLSEKGNNISEAEKMYSEALRIAESTIGNDDKLIVKYIVNIASFYYKNHNEIRAFKYYERAWITYLDTGSTDQKIYIDIVFNTANLFIKKQKFPDALFFYNLALNTIGSVRGDYNLKKMQILSAMARLQEKSQQHEEAKKSYLAYDKILEALPNDEKEAYTKSITQFIDELCNGK